MKYISKRKLLGLMIIVLIVSSGIGGFLLFQNLQNNTARHKATRTSIGAIKQSIEMFAKKHEGRFPSSIAELIGPRKKNELWCFGNGKTLADSWGTDFEYKTDGKTFSLRSAGPDMKMGTKDDITN